MNRVLRRVAEVFAVPVVLVTVWWFASASSTDIYFPPLRTIAEAFGPTWIDGGSQSRLVTDVLPSLLRLALGYGLAALIGIGGGLLIGSVRTLRALVEPVLEIFRAIPPPAMVPVLIALAGIDTLMKVLVIVFGCVWPILLNTVEGVRAVEPVLVDVCRSYGISGARRVRSLVLRSASPQIMTGLRQALSIGIILMVISEMFAASNGLGFTIVQFQRSFAIPEMWSGIILLGLIGFGLSLIFRLAERRVLRWYEGLRAAQRAG